MHEDFKPTITEEMIMGDEKLVAKIKDAVSQVGTGIVMTADDAIAWLQSL